MATTYTPSLEFIAILVRLPHHNLSHELYPFKPCTLKQTWRGHRLPVCHFFQPSAASTTPCLPDAKFLTRKYKLSLNNLVRHISALIRYEHDRLARPSQNVYFHPRHFKDIFDIKFYVSNPRCPPITFDLQPNPVACAAIVTGRTKVISFSVDPSRGIWSLLMAGGPRMDRIGHAADSSFPLANLRHGAERHNDSSTKR